MNEVVLDVAETVSESPSTGIYTEQITQGLQQISTVEGLLILACVLLAITIGILFADAFFRGLK